jgi:hypothetical protein
MGNEMNKNSFVKDLFGEYYIRKPVITHPSEYYAWMNMKQRCNNQFYYNFKYWGGRGIKICIRWSKFENFLEDMGYKPSPELMLERVDNNKGYSKDNCKWATREEQMKNRAWRDQNVA